ncbi:EamA-like transporter family protein [bacterium BMS3Abin15]|nr:EamA-like transporter family protein [bacterium BMS3Abin15]
MEWFFIALIAPALWGVSNYLDKYLISKFFKSGGTGAILGFSSIVGLFVLPFIYIIVPNIFGVTIGNILVIMLSGVLVTVGYLFYYYALKDHEASAVVPVFQSIPVFSLLLGYFFLGEVLTSIQMSGMGIVILGSIGLSLDLTEEKIKFEKRMLWLMFLSSLALAASAFAFKFIAIGEGFGISIFWSYAGFILSSALIVIFIESYRDQFKEIFKVNKSKVLGLSLVNEVVDVGANMIIKYAFMLAPLALVWTVNGFQPFFVLIFGILLSMFFPHIIKEDITKKHLIKKLLFIIIIFIGGYFLIS